MNKSILGFVNLQKVGAVITTVTLLVTLFTPFLINVADAATLGPNYPDIVSDDGSGQNWSQEGDADADDGQYASASLSATGTNRFSQDLTATDFDFSIPTSSVINGIQVSIERLSSANTGGFSVQDNVVQLIKSGSSTGDNKATTSSWPTSATVANYGGVSDLWGTTWTPAQINASNFGVLLKAWNQSSIGARTASVDYIRVTVTYSTAPASTTTGVSCANVNFGSSTTCTATVTRVSGTNTPSGNVTWSSNAAGTFTPSTTCTLAGASSSSRSCSVTYAPTAFNAGSHTVTANYGGDSNFTASSGNQALTVSDVTPPVFGATPNITEEATNSTGNNVVFSITATDNVDISVTPVCTPASGSLFPISTTAVNCTATDTAGNSATSTFNVTVEDTTKPVINLIGSPTVNLNVGQPYTDAGFTASDNIDGDITANVTSTGSVNTGTPGTYPIDFNVSDANGNAADTVTRTVFVSDISAPVINPITDITTEATGPTGAVVNYGAVTATDDVDGVISASCTPVDGSTFAVGTTTVACTATDSATNVGNGTGLTISVVDTTAPTLTLNGAASTTLQIGDTYTELGATFSDIVDVTGIVNIGGDIVPAGPLTATGTYNVTYDATDLAGNAATQINRTVTVTNMATTSLTISLGSGAPSGVDVIVTVGSTTSTYTAPVILNDGDVFEATTTPVLGYSVIMAGTCSGTATFGGPYVCSFDYSTSSFDIVASAGSNGTISPSGTVNVSGGANQAFTITPDSGFQISDVLVDGVSVGGVSTYTFSSVVANHTIAASFSAIPPVPPTPPSGGGGGGGGSVTLVSVPAPTGGNTGGTTGGGSTPGTQGGTTPTDTTGGTTGGGTTGNTGGTPGLVLGATTENTGTGTTTGSTAGATGGTTGTTGETVTPKSSVPSGTSDSTSTASSTSTSTDEVAEDGGLMASMLDILGGNMNLLILLIALFGIAGLIYYFSRG